MTKSQVLAASLLCVFRAHAQTAIYSATGFGTYYYNIGQTNACGSDFAAQNEGFVECSPLAALSLNQINSEYLVAMNHSQLVGNMAKYCGKRVIVSVNGVPSSLPLFIGDGCKRCSTGSSSIWDPNGAPGLDFSYSALSDLSANACTDGHISISWKIMDETLYDFYTEETGSLEGTVVGSGKSTTAPARTNTPNATPEPLPKPCSTD
jgi:hypothetical protein